MTASCDSRTHYGTMVSVIIPAYNASAHLSEAIESAIKQTHKCVEIIVVDDGSEDGTADIAASYLPLIHYIRQPNGGAALARNTGIAAASGKYCALLDADDTWLPDKIGRQVDVLETDDSVVACGCQAELIDSKSQLIGEMRCPLSDAAIRFELLGWCPLINSGVLMRKDAFIAAGGYSHDATPTEDYKLWTQIAKYGRLINVPDKLMSYRVHDGSTSKRFAERQRLIGEQVGIAYAMSLGLAPNEDCGRKLCCAVRAMFSPRHGSLCIDQAMLVCDALNQFVIRQCVLKDYSASSLMELRTRLRWRMLDCAASHSKCTGAYWRWLGMARRVDPEAMRIPNIATRLLSRACAG